MKLALQECGRKLARYVNKKKRASAEQGRVSIFEAYIPEASELLSEILGTSRVSIQQEMNSMLAKNKEFIIKNKGIPDGSETKD